MELYKVAVETSNFVIAMKITDRYSFVLKDELNETVRTLLDSLESYPYFAEVKLAMLSKLVPIIDFEMAKIIVKAL